MSTVTSTLSAAVMWPRTSVTVSSWLLSPSPSPARIRTTSDLPRAVRAGCAPVAVWPPTCRDGPWRAGPSAGDHARGAWDANAAGRRCRPADPRSGAAWARLVGRAGPGHARRPRAGQTSHQLPSPSALASPPGQESRPPRPPVAAFASPAPPPYTCCRAVTEAGVSHWPARWGNRQGPPPHRRRSRQASSNGAPSSSSLAYRGSYPTRTAR
jgi:hypothetical protein